MPPNPIHLRDFVLYIHVNQISHLMDDFMVALGEYLCSGLRSKKKNRSLTAACTVWWLYQAGIFLHSSFSLQKIFLLNDLSILRSDYTMIFIVTKYLHHDIARLYFDEKKICFKQLKLYISYEIVTCFNLYSTSFHKI